MLFILKRREKILVIHGSLMVLPGGPSKNLEKRESLRLKQLGAKTVFY